VGLDTRRKSPYVVCTEYLSDFVELTLLKTASTHMDFISLAIDTTSEMDSSTRTLVETDVGRHWLKFEIFAYIKPKLVLYL
jgi:hypothetical protein